MHSLTTDCNQNNYDYCIALIIVSLTSLTECISKIMHIYILLCYLWNYIYAKPPKITLHINHLLCMSIGSLSTKLSKFYFFSKIHLFNLLDVFGQYVSTVLRYCLKSIQVNIKFFFAYHKDRYASKCFWYASTMILSMYKNPLNLWNLYFVNKDTGLNSFFWYHCLVVNIMFS